MGQVNQSNNLKLTMNRNQPKIIDLMSAARPVPTWRRVLKATPFQFFLTKVVTFSLPECDDDVILRSYIHRYGRVLASKPPNKIQSQGKLEWHIFALTQPLT